MAEKNDMPDPALGQKDLQQNEEYDRFREVLRKNNIRSLHGKCPASAALHARADSPDASIACCELYSRIRHRYLPLQGEWLYKAGFIDGMPIKIRVMPDCIVITPQNTRELWGCVEGLSVVDINKQKVSGWLKTFPGALNDTGNIPLIKRKLPVEAN
ncbi:type I toxin-antitoxin system SymE family toxin [Enterobacteriaceae bacterium 89]|nr:type I toxin-antitoxin system SymE family toxin [Enterobacteriaceae bacterium 89]